MKITQTEVIGTGNERINVMIRTKQNLNNINNDKNLNFHCNICIWSKIAICILQKQRKSLFLKNTTPQYFGHIFDFAKWIFQSLPFFKFFIHLVRLPALLAWGSKNYSHGGEGPRARRKVENKLS